MGSLYKLFLSLDIFGTSHAINFRGSDSYKTSFGALASLIFYCMVI